MEAVVTDDLLGRIEEELEDVDSSADGPSEIGNQLRTGLLENGGDTTSILYPDLPYDDNPGSAFASEFDQILDTQAAAQAASPSNDLDAFTRVREAERAADNEVAPFACTNPPSYDRGNLGQSVTLLPGKETSTSVFADGEPQMVAFWPGEDREVCPIVVTAAPVLPYTSDIVRLVGKIQWGVHGARYEMLFDVGTGVEFTLNAANAYLALYLEGGDFTGGSTPADMQPQIAAGSIGFQQASRQQPVVRSAHSAGNVANGGTFTVTRPAFGMSLLSFERGDISGPTTLEFLDQNGTTRFLRQYAALQYITDPISLMGEIASIKVTNGGNATTIDLIFGLL